jgi:hypothetical protein
MARAAGCVVCDGVLHSSLYPRKPRGGPAELPGYDWRHSFCCAVEGCRKRTTPPSVRFLGRKVYLGVVVVLASALRHGATPARLARLRAELGVCRRTVERWRIWWREIFVESRFWRAAKGRFASPVGEATLPQSLLERFGGDEVERLVHALEFVAPITTASAGKLALVEGRQ